MGCHGEEIIAHLRAEIFAKIITNAFDSLEVIKQDPEKANQSETFVQLGGIDLYAIYQGEDYAKKSERYSANLDIVQLNRTDSKQIKLGNNFKSLYLNPNFP